MSDIAATHPRQFARPEKRAGREKKPVTTRFIRSTQGTRKTREERLYLSCHSRKVSPQRVHLPLEFQKHISFLERKLLLRKERLPLVGMHIHVDLEGDRPTGGT